MESKKSELLWVYITTKDEAEAVFIGERLVEFRLAACANIIPGIKSIYEWEGKLCFETEVVLLAKTTDDALPALIDLVKRTHSYECPCIVAMPVVGGSDDYMAWVRGQVNSRTPISRPETRG